MRARAWALLLLATPCAAQARDSTSYLPLYQPAISPTTPADFVPLSPKTGQVNGLPRLWLSSPGIVTAGFVSVNQGTALAATNVAQSAGWGVGATVVRVAGTAQRFVFTDSASGAPGASPTNTITFPVAWPAVPFFLCKMVGGTGTLTTLSGEGTATTGSMVVTFNGTPVAASTYQIQCVGL